MANNQTRARTIAVLVSERSKLPRRAFCRFCRLCADLRTQTHTRARSCCADKDGAQNLTSPSVAVCSSCTQTSAKSRRANAALVARVRNVAATILTAPPPSPPPRIDNTRSSGDGGGGGGKADDDDDERRKRSSDSKQRRQRARARAAARVRLDNARSHQSSARRCHRGRRLRPAFREDARRQQRERVQTSDRDFQ